MADLLAYWLEPLKRSLALERQFSLRLDGACHSSLPESRLSSVRAALLPSDSIWPRMLSTPLSFACPCLPRSRRCALLSSRMSLYFYSQGQSYKAQRPFLLVLVSPPPSFPHQLQLPLHLPLLHSTLSSHTHALPPPSFPLLPSPTPALHTSLLSSFQHHLAQLQRSTVTHAVPHS